MSMKYGDPQFMAIYRGLRASLARYPNCPVASCDCRSKTGEWEKGCNCPCHFFQMDVRFGKDKWTFVQFTEQAKTGL